MKPYLQVEDLTKSYGDRMLFDSVTFGINEGDKIGLIAKNGTGKSTLLRILSGEEAPDSGSVTFRNGLRVGFLAQIPDFAPGKAFLTICSRQCLKSITKTGTAKTVCARCCHSLASATAE